MNVSFQTAIAADTDVLLTMMAAYYGAEGYPFDAQAARAALTEILGDDRLGRVWLIVVGAHPVGYLVVTLGFSLEYHGCDAFIDELYIRADHRRRGIGKRAIGVAEAACVGLGVHALHLEVERANDAAQALYRGAGFADGDRYLMTKRLA